MDRAEALVVEGLNRACGTRESKPGHPGRAAVSAEDVYFVAEHMRRRERDRARHACLELFLVILLQSARTLPAARWGAACWKAVAGPVGTQPAHPGRAISECGLYLRRSEIQNG